MVLGMTMVCRVQGCEMLACGAAAVEVDLRVPLSADDNMLYVGLQMKD